MVDAPVPFYSKGDITIYHADCREVLPLLGRGSVDLVLTDPPYGVTSQGWDTAPDLPELWGLLGPLLGPTGAVAMTAIQPFASRVVCSREGWFKHEWIWQKTRAANFGGARYQPMKKHESVLVFAPKRYKYRPIKEAGDAYRSRTQRPRGNTKYGTFGTEDFQPDEVRSQRYPSSIVRVPSMRQQDMLHPTQKPLPLMEYFVRSYGDEGDLVLDPYMGVGTTLLAALRLGRRAIGIESDEGYCRKAVDLLGREASRASA